MKVRPKRVRRWLRNRVRVFLEVASIVRKPSTCASNVGGACRASCGLRISRRTGDLRTLNEVATSQGCCVLLAAAANSTSSSPFPCSSGGVLMHTCSIATTQCSSSSSKVMVIQTFFDHLNVLGSGMERLLAVATSSTGRRGNVEAFSLLPPTP